MERKWQNWGNCPTILVARMASWLQNDHINAEAIIKVDHSSVLPKQLMERDTHGISECGNSIGSHFYFALFCDPAYSPKKIDHCVLLLWYFVFNCRTQWLPQLVWCVWVFESKSVKGWSVISQHQTRRWEEERCWWLQNWSGSEKEIQKRKKKKKRIRTK